LLKAVKANFEQSIGTIDGVVITVPANYLDSQRREVRAAGERAGLNVLRIINEPSAAAIAYAVSEARPHGRAVVIDWGGGTLDVSLVDCDSDVLDILASDGDPLNGGKDLDRALLELLTRKFPSELRPVLADEIARDSLLLQLERVKRRLSSEARVEESIVVRSGSGTHFIEIDVSRDEFEREISPWVDRVMLAVKRTLDKAPDGRLDPKAVGDVLLVGGSCFTPLLRKRIHEFFGKPGRVDVNPMEVVALGAAYQAENHATPGDLFVLHSLATHLGTSVVGLDQYGIPRPDRFSIIIPATTKIPAELSREYGTVMDDQTSVSLDIFEGSVNEGDDISGCVLLDRREITGLKPGEAGKLIRVTFRYDIQQLLRVTVDVPDDGIHEDWVLSTAARIDADDRASRERVESIVSASLQHYRDVIARVTAALPVGGADGPRKELAELEACVEGGNPMAAEAALRRLMDALFDAGIHLDLK
jgi:molecular chaperone DnaK (HSP70)